MIVTVVTGSRNWIDRAAVERALQGSDAAILGDCPTGADAIALAICKTWDIITMVHVANWKQYGNGAGAPGFARYRGLHRSAGDAGV